MKPPESHDSKQAEKEYLRRTAAGEWERLKPFSPPGAHTLADSSKLIQDFAAAIGHLPPAPSDLILDLAAGACWCSDWLQRLNFRTVAVDISHDMLRLGRSRLPHAESAWLVAGDLEHLPFASATFDKAYCLSAIHHVPDIRGALREIHRVLTADGAALFSEPGTGHAGRPSSVAAMRDFGVLEQDIVVTEFLDACRDAGFVDARLKPMSYVIPDFDLTREHWDAWRRLAGSKRPVRAAAKIWRGVLEFVGAGKRGPLFEEAFAMRVVRLLRAAMEDHPVIVAAKRAPHAESSSEHRARVRLVAAPEVVTRGERLLLHALVENTGSREWQTSDASGVGYVRLGVQVLDAERRLVNRDFHRESLPGPIAAGAEIDYRFECPAPDRRGVYHLKLDLVLEGITWFETHGSEVAVQRVEVR